MEWDDDSTFSGSNTAEAAGASHTVSGLREDTEYFVRVRATRAGAADGPSSDAASATTDLQPPAQVSGLGAAAASDTEIVVTWDLALRAGAYLVQWGKTS